MLTLILTICALKAASSCWEDARTDPSYIDATGQEQHLSIGGCISGRDVQYMIVEYQRDHPRRKVVKWACQIGRGKGKEV